MKFKTLSFCVSKSIITIIVQFETEIGEVLQFPFEKKKKKRKRKTSRTFLQTQTRKVLVRFSKLNFNQFKNFNDCYSVKMN